jgi:hypothetical protein
VLEWWDDYHATKASIILIHSPKANAKAKYRFIKQLVDLIFHHCKMPVEKRLILAVILENMILLRVYGDNSAYLDVVRRIIQLRIDYVRANPAILNGPLHNPNVARSSMVGTSRYYQTNNNWQFLLEQENHNAEALFQTYIERIQELDATYMPTVIEALNPFGEDPPPPPPRGKMFAHLPALCAANAAKGTLNLSNPESMDISGSTASLPSTPGGASFSTVPTAGSILNIPATPSATALTFITTSTPITTTSTANASAASMSSPQPTRQINTVPPADIFMLYGRLTAASISDLQHYILYTNHPLRQYISLMDLAIRISIAISTDFAHLQYPHLTPAGETLYHFPAEEMQSMLNGVVLSYCLPPTPITTAAVMTTTSAASIASTAPSTSSASAVSSPPSAKKRKRGSPSNDDNGDKDGDNNAG